MTPPRRAGPALKQQHFFVSSALQDMLAHLDLRIARQRNFPDLLGRCQLNDHPSLDSPSPS